jgi:hypothetical protein
MKPARCAKGLRQDATSVSARARVLDAEGRLLADDTLGNCIYLTLDEFATSHRDADPMNRNCTLMRQARGQNVIICHSFPDMVRVVCAAARVTLQKHGAIHLRPHRGTSMPTEFSEVTP